jgi:hypothetical protein
MKDRRDSWAAAENLIPSSLDSYEKKNVYSATSCDRCPHQRRRRAGHEHG